MDVYLRIGTMKILKTMRNVFLAACGLAATACNGTNQVQVTPLHGFPSDEEGIAKGVSACYAGLIDGQLVMAGGCNFPGPRRTQPVSALFEREGEYTFYLWGGFAGATDGDPVTLSVDGLKYETATGRWTPVAGPKDSEGVDVCLGGGTAAVMDGNKVVATGGVDKDIFYNALIKLPECYFEHEPEWFNFNRNILVYDPATDTWSVAAHTSETARAGAVLVGEGRIFANICGELMPGVRSPQVTLITFPAK